MKKKFLFLAAVVLSLYLAYSYTLPYAYQWHVLDMMTDIEYKPTDEQITLFVCGIVSFIILVASLVLFSRDLKANSNWKLTYALGVIGCLIIILANVIINTIMFYDGYNPFREAQEGQLFLSYVLPVIIIILLILSFIYSRKTEE